MASIIGNDAIGDADDEQGAPGALDPRVKDYLDQLMKRGDYYTSPEYGRQMAQMRSEDAQQDITRAQLGGVVEGLSKLGTLRGQSPDVKPVTTTLDKISAAAKNQNAMQGADADDEQKQLGMNAKVYEYLQGQATKASEGASNRDLKKAQIAAAAQSKAEHDETLRAIADSRQNITIQNQAAKADAADAKVDAKTSKDQADAYTHMRHDLENFRGNAAAQQASRDVLSADKALQLVKNKDPNTLTQQDLRLLSEELGKIASGGVPGEQGVQALMPNNLQSKWADFQNFVMSSPTPAQAGAYIQHNMKYLEDMKGEAQKTISNYRANIAKGYKRRVHPDDYNEALGDYGISQPATTGQPPAAAPSAPQPQPAAGTAVAAPGGMKVIVRKQHNKALNKTRVFYADGTQEELDGLQ